MCGDHSSGTNTHGPNRRPSKRLQRVPQLRSRRKFLGEFGRGSLALAVLTPAVLASCSSTGEPAAQDDDGDNGQETEQPSTTLTGETTTDLMWARTNLDFVSAYVLARGSRAAIVDTGTKGSADAIGQTLKDIGLTYNDVEHLILTHHHGDHAGSTGAVMDQAVNATVWAGDADLAEIDYDTISGVSGGEDIFGFEVLATPGHTAGHISVIDHDAGLVVAGDALWAEEGTSVVEGPKRFFEDVEQSRDSIRELAALRFDTLLVGHGDPITSDADQVVAELANALT